MIMFYLAWFFEPWPSASANTLSSRQDHVWFDAYRI